MKTLAESIFDDNQTYINKSLTDVDPFDIALNDNGSFDTLIAWFKANKVMPTRAIGIDTPLYPLFLDTRYKDWGNAKTWTLWLSNKSKKAKYIYVSFNYSNFNYSNDVKTIQVNRFCPVGKHKEKLDDILIHLGYKKKIGPRDIFYTKKKSTK